MQKNFLEKLKPREENKRMNSKRKRINYSVIDTCEKCKKNACTFQFGWCKDCIIQDLTRLKNLLNLELYFR